MCKDRDFAVQFCEISRRARAARARKWTSGGPVTEHRSIRTRDSSARGIAGSTERAACRYRIFRGERGKCARKSFMGG